MDTVLIIDDMQDIREMLSLFLSKKGFAVLEASTGEEGVSKAREASPAVILVDMCMPDMEGTEVIRRIKAFDRKIKIILLSGSMSDKTREKARACGAWTTLSKAADLDEIGETLRRALAG